jgi:uncharacterized protein
MTMSDSTTQTVADGYVNMMTGLGGRKDASLYARPRRESLSDDDAAAWVESSWLANRVVSKLVQDALSLGFEVAVPGDKPATDGVNAYLRRLDLSSGLEQCSRWARTFGGAGLLVGCTDGQVDYGLPVDTARVQSVTFLTPLERRELAASIYQRDPTKPDYGWPSRYTLTTSGASVGTASLHASRLVRFEGVMSGRPNSPYNGVNNGWGESVLSLMYKTASGFEQSWAGVWQAMKEFSVSIYKLKDLVAMFAAGQGEAAQKRMAQLDGGKSQFQAVVLDGDRETYERVAVSFTGVPDILQRAMVLISAAVDIPVPVLFGMTASGLSSTGDGDARTWHQTVDSYRRDVLTPAIRQVADLVFAAKDGPTRGLPPENYEVKWPALFTPSLAEQAAVRKIMAETDAIYMGLGIVTAKDVAMSRFGGESFSVDTNVDIEGVVDVALSTEGE